MTHDISNWTKVEALLLERFGKIPDLDGILYLIGINELGQIPLEGQKFSKEQKQDLMHIAVCTLLAHEGYFSFTGYDEDGWPHFIPTEKVPPAGLAEQELLLKKCMTEYFNVQA